jgi:hypothetical protein
MRCIDFIEKLREVEVSFSEVRPFVVFANPTCCF